MILTEAYVLLDLIHSKRAYSVIYCETFRRGFYQVRKRIKILKIILHMLLHVVFVFDCFVLSFQSYTSRRDVRNSRASIRIVYFIQTRGGIFLLFDASRFLILRQMGYDSAVFRGFCIDVIMLKNSSRMMFERFFPLFGTKQRLIATHTLWATLGLYGTFWVGMRRCFVSKCNKSELLYIFGAKT